MQKFWRYNQLETQLLVKDFKTKYDNLSAAADLSNSFRVLKDC